MIGGGAGAVAAAVLLCLLAAGGVRLRAGGAGAAQTARPEARAGAHPIVAADFVTPEQFAVAVAQADEVATEIHRLAGDGGGAGEASDSASAVARPVAAVVPHHLIGARLIAGLLAYLADEPPTTLVIVGPDHRNAGPPVGVGTADWQVGGGEGTVVGTVAVDQALVGRLLRERIGVEANEVQAGEHSLGNMLPFVRRYLPETRVVTLSLRGDLAREQAIGLGRFLRSWKADGQLFVLASIDFSHYLDRGQADRCDALTLTALRRGDWDRLFTLGPNYLDSPAALAVAFAFAGSLDQPKPLVVEHLNSATVLGQPALRETTSYFLMVAPPAKEDMPPAGAGSPATRLRARGEAQHQGRLSTVYGGAPGDQEVGTALQDPHGGGRVNCPTGPAGRSPANSEAGRGLTTAQSRSVAGRKGVTVDKTPPGHASQDSGPWGGPVKWASQRSKVH
ncbi:MAG TPA: AmmeMemoRadiSam system protein B [Bacillota bacterium]|jgi:hypothetical protein